MSLPLNIDFQQILLHMFNLILLFGGLYLLLYKPVKKFMDDRESRYKQMDEEANEKLARATAAEAEIDDKRRAADEQIAKETAKIRRDAEEQAEDIIKEAKKIKKQMIIDAEDAANREKSRMITDAREELAQLAVKAAEKVLIEKTSAEVDKNA